MLTDPLQRESLFQCRAAHVALADGAQLNLCGISSRQGDGLAKKQTKRVIPCRVCLCGLAHLRLLGGQLVQGSSHTQKQRYSWTGTAERGGVGRFDERSSSGRNNGCPNWKNGIAVLRRGTTGR